MSYREYLVRGEFDKLFQHARGITSTITTVKLDKLLNGEVNGNTALDLCDELDFVYSIYDLEKPSYKKQRKIIPKQ